MLLKSQDISVVREKKEILKNINLEIDHNDFVTIIGPNGAGKSMLLKCLLGFFKPDNGSIVSSPDLKVSYVPQNFMAERSIPITAFDFIKSHLNSMWTLCLINKSLIYLVANFRRY